MNAAASPAGAQAFGWLALASAAVLALGVLLLGGWLFPLVECAGNACLIGPNPVGWAFLVAGSAGVVLGVAARRPDSRDSPPRGP